MAINVEGSQTKYREFVQEQGYDHLWVARDNSGQIASDYQVRGIPLTYILDAEGMIRHVHVGYGGSLKDTMAQEIESLISSAN